MFDRLLPLQLVAPWAATVILAARLGLAASAIPPWQGPDEPQHFGRTAILAAHPEIGLSDIGKFTSDVERPILESMARFGWWRHYGERPPDPIPRFFNEIHHHVTPIAGPFEPLYHLVAARLLRVLDAGGLVEGYTALRWLSAVFALATLWCVWAGNRILFGDGVAAGGAGLMALHPQFALAGIIVGPTPLADLCAAFVWWQTAEVIRGRRIATPLVALLAAVGVGLVTKRVLGPLVGIAGIVIVVALVRVARADRIRGVQFALATAVTVLASLAALAGINPQALGRLQASWSAFFFPRVIEAEPGFVWRFHGGLFDSAWLNAGWLRHPAPDWWYAAVHTITIVALAGAVVAWLRWRDRAARVGLLVAGGFASLQLLAIWITFLPNQFGAQGQYLFPAIGPFLALFFVGFCAWWPARLRPYAAAGLVLVMAALDIAGWATVIMPAYL